MGMSKGATVSAEATFLTGRAARYLTNGPADVVDLIGHICNLPRAPRIVAEHMAEAMFAGRTEFSRDKEGRWLLTETLATSAVSSAISGTYDASIAVTSRAYSHPSPPDLIAPRHASVRVTRTRGRYRSDLPPEPIAGTSFVVVDVETTGGRPRGGDRITEFAAVVVEGGEIREIFETLVNPLRPIPPFVSRLTKINWAMVKDAPTFDLIAARVVSTMSGNVFVAHNAAFDWRFVSTEVRRASGTALSGRRLCTVQLARQLLPHLARRSLDHVANYYGIEITARHRAGGDALATARCLIRMLNDAADRGCSTWQDLDLLLGARTLRRRRRYSAMPAPVTRDTTA